jgi:adenylate kinase
LISESSNLYIFFGPPGSGKGSLSMLCVKKLGWVQLSAGNLCRQEIANNTEIGQQIDFTIKSGKLIPDGLITHMIEGALYKLIRGSSAIILDGYPRTVPQAQELDRILLKSELKDINLSLVRLNVSDDTVIKRMSGRLICPNESCQAVYSLSEPALSPRRAMECDFCQSTLIRRADDRDEVIRERLMQYYANEKNLLDYYHRHKDHSYEIPAEKPLEEVFNELKFKIGIE